MPKYRVCGGKMGDKYVTPDEAVTFIKQKQDGGGGKPEIIISPNNIEQGKSKGRLGGRKINYPVLMIMSFVVVLMLALLIIVVSNKGKFTIVLY